MVHFAPSTNKNIWPTWKWSAVKTGFLTSQKVISHEGSIFQCIRVMIRCYESAIMPFQQCYCWLWQFILKCYCNTVFCQSYNEYCDYIYIKLCISLSWYPLLFVSAKWSLCIFILKYSISQFSFFFIGTETQNLMWHVGKYVKIGHIQWEFICL